jgi:hypothetical protein
MLKNIEDLKKAICEDMVQYFTDEDLAWYVEQNGGDYEAAAYHCLTVKAEQTGLQLSGMTTKDTSSYFLRLARRYKQRRSGVLTGGGLVE